MDYSINLKDYNNPIKQVWHEEVKEFDLNSMRIHTIYMLHNKIHTDTGLIFEDIKH